MLFFPSVRNNRDGTITISGVPIQSIIRFTREYYGAVKFINVLATNLDTYSPVFNTTDLIVYEFFVPELLFLFQEMRSRHYGGYRLTKLIDLLMTETWYKDADITKIKSAFDMSVFGKEINPELKPLPAQLEFIRDVYWQYKVAYKLKGYLLSLPPGCGKSLTSLFLAAGLHKTKLIIIAPLSVVANVWVGEVEKAFTQKKVIATSVNKAPVNNKTDVVIINYEAIDNYTPDLLKYFKGDDTMVIIDECHNFKDINSKRTVSLVNLCTRLGCNDILMMSGTPVKAFGSEALPILRLLAGYYNLHIEKRLKDCQRYTKIMNSLMCHRLGLMMFRRTKEEVFTLPPKHELDLLVKLKHGFEYTLPSVKQKMEIYRDERSKYYAQHKKAFEASYDKAINFYRKVLAQPNQPREMVDGFNKYMKIVTMFRANGYDMSHASEAHIARLYEDEWIIPNLPTDLKKEFKASRAVVKYVELKILGEVLGNLVGRLRMEMTSDMLDDPRIANIIRDAEKKTLLFTSYQDTIQLAADKCKDWGFKPMVIDGSNSKMAKDLVAEFKAKDDINPLIASLQVMSTGHTINEANTVIFLNVPFRSVDYEQASDRCYRIGQDTEVFVYKLILDTGTIPNLSTRMHDIVAWSKEQFTAIVGDEPEELTSTVKTNEFKQLVAASNLTQPNNSFVDDIMDTIKSLFS